MKIPFTLWMNVLNFKKVKCIYIRFGLVYESLAHEVDRHVCSLFLYLLTCTLDLFVLCNITARMYQSLSVTQWWCGTVLSCPVSAECFKLVLLCYYCLCYNNLCYVQTSNIVQGLVTTLLYTLYWLHFLTFYTITLCNFVVPTRSVR